MAADAARPLYAVLNVAPDAAAEDIKRAYRRLALEHHPDRRAASATAGARAAGADAFARLALAYEVLGDAQRRKRYDLTGELPENDAALGREAGQTLLEEYLKGAPETARGVEQQDMSLHSLDNYEVIQVDGRSGSVPTYMRDIVMIGLGYLANVVERMEEKEVVLLRHFVMDQMYVLLAYDPPLDKDAFEERGYAITYYDNPLQSGIRPTWSDQNGLDKKQGGQGAFSELKQIDEGTIERRRLAALEWHGAPAQPSRAPEPDPEVPGAGQGPERLRLGVRALLRQDPDALCSDVHSLRRRLEGILRLEARALDSEGGTSLMRYLLEAMEELEREEGERQPEREPGPPPQAPLAPSDAGPAVGSAVRVLSSGRVGEVLVHDQGDPGLAYKVKFCDGADPEVDWYPADAVACA